jgi:hypothetical protein
LTPNSIRVRLPDLEMPWQTAVDELIAAIERARPVRLAGAAAE